MQESCYTCNTEEYDRLIIVLLGSDSVDPEAANFSWDFDYTESKHIKIYFSQLIFRKTSLEITKLV